MKIRGYRPLATNVLVVATEGDMEDWTAYIGAVPRICHDTEKELVARNGDKIQYEIAKILFPHLDETLKWRD